MTSLHQIESSLADLRSQYNRAAGKLEGLQEDKKAAQKNLAAAKNDIAVWEQVQALFTKASEFARVQLKARIEDTVSAALQAVFEDDSEFRVHIRTLSGAPAAEWLLVSNKGNKGSKGDDGSSDGNSDSNRAKVISDTEDGDGGGANDVTSLALRAALLELSRPKPGGPLILDEPGKHVDRQARPNVAQFVKQYIGKAGRQGLLVTHFDELESVADTGYRVSMVDGISEAVRI
jgi:DNA repair exonuclease SbcCD ATPase subunit